MTKRRRVVVLRSGESEDESDYNKMDSSTHKRKELRTHYRRILRQVSGRKKFPCPVDGCGKQVSNITMFLHQNKIEE